ncbi:serine/threonine-protein kinase M1 [Ascosphaera pollenicola]|nr:serine/threonine-protein kinase M1 [Ascosphaera pollenicola]
MLDKIFKVTVGYSANDFQFIENVTLLSSWKETAGILIAYYIICFGGRELMRNREPMRLTTLTIIHNFFLTAISAILLALFVEELIPTLWRHNLYYAICDSNGGWTQKMVTLYYVTYLTKYYELLDTIFLVLKKKPLTFLHTYHHGATALLVWTQLLGGTAVSWVVIDLNLAVHVVMYYYYMQSARGVRIWWKKYITVFQIVQFVIDLGG